MTGTDNGPASDYTPGETPHDPEFSFGGNFNDVQLTDKVGTQLYMSPEQILGNKYNQKVRCADTLEFLQQSIVQTGSLKFEPLSAQVPLRIPGRYILSGAHIFRASLVASDADGAGQHVD